MPCERGFQAGKNPRRLLGGWLLSLPSGSCDPDMSHIKIHSLLSKISQSLIPLKHPLEVLGLVVQSGPGSDEARWVAFSNTAPPVQFLISMPVNERNTMPSHHLIYNGGTGMCSVAQSCQTLCGPMDCSLPGSSVLGIFQARILQWLPLPPLGDLPNPGIEIESH